MMSEHSLPTWIAPRVLTDSNRHVSRVAFTKRQPQFSRPIPSPTHPAPNPPKTTPPSSSPSPPASSSAFATPGSTPPGASEDDLKTRTLTKLYNARPEWLANAHRTLDEAVFAAYGWPTNLTDQEILAHLLALDHERFAAQSETTR